MPQNQTVIPQKIRKPLPRLLSDWFVKLSHQKKLLVLGIVLIVFLAGGFGYFTYHRHQLDQLHARELLQRQQLERHSTTIHIGQTADQFIKQVGKKGPSKKLGKTGP